MGGRTSCCGGEEQQEVVYHRTVDAELFKLAAGNRRPCNEQSMCTQLYGRTGIGGRDSGTCVPEVLLE